MCTSNAPSTGIRHASKPIDVKLTFVTPKRPPIAKGEKGGAENPERCISSSAFLLIPSIGSEYPPLLQRARTVALFHVYCNSALILTDRKPPGLRVARIPRI